MHTARQISTLLKMLLLKMLLLKEVNNNGFSILFPFKLNRSQDILIIPRLEAPLLGRAFRALRAW
jgi:hypothetical protein